MLKKKATSTSHKDKSKDTKHGDKDNNNYGRHRSSSTSTLPSGSCVNGPLPTLSDNKSTHSAQVNDHHGGKQQHCTSRRTHKFSPQHYRYKYNKQRSPPYF